MEIPTDLFFNEIIKKHLSLLEVGRLCQSFPQPLCENLTFWRQVGQVLFPELTQQLIDDYYSDETIGQYYQLASQLLEVINKMVSQYNHIILMVESPTRFAQGASQFWLDQLRLLGSVSSIQQRITLTQITNGNYLIISQGNDVVSHRFLSEKAWLELLTSLLILSENVTANYQVVNDSLLNIRLILV